MKDVFVKVMLFDPATEDPIRGDGMQVFEDITVDIARIEPYRPGAASDAVVLTPDPVRRIFLVHAPGFEPGPEHYFRVYFAQRNFSRVTQTLLAPKDVTTSRLPVFSPARTPFWDSGWDDNYETNEFFADADVRVSSSPEQPITLAIPLRRLFVIGHRGAPYVFPENTIASFAAALDMGANGLEFDICLTKDHRLAIFHDPSPDPTRVWFEDFPYELVSPEFDGETAVIREFRSGAYRIAHRRKMRSGTSFDIMMLSFEQVRRWYRYRHVGGQEHPIPDLDEFLAFASREVPRLDLLFFDVKNPSWDEERDARKFRYYGELIGKTLLRQPTLPDHLVVANASEVALHELKAGILAAGERRCTFAYDAAGGLRAMVGLAKNPLDVARAMGNSVVSVGTRLRAGDLEEIADATRDRDYNTGSLLTTVIHWTINDPTQMSRSLNAGVNGIITDRPDVLVGLMRQHGLATGAVDEPRKPPLSTR